MVGAVVEVLFFCVLTGLCGVAAIVVVEWGEWVDVGCEALLSLPSRVVLRHVECLRASWWVCCSVAVVGMGIVLLMYVV